MTPCVAQPFRKDVFLTAAAASAAFAGGCSRSQHLERPEVRGLRLNQLDVPSLKYVWIDSSGRLQ